MVVRPAVEGSTYGWPLRPARILIAQVWRGILGKGEGAEVSIAQALRPLPLIAASPDGRYWLGAALPCCAGPIFCWSRPTKPHGVEIDARQPSAVTTSLPCVGKRIRMRPSEVAPS